MIDKFMIMQIFKKSNDKLMNSPNIVNTTKYISVNMEMSLFTSTRKIVGKYVVLLLNNSIDNKISQTKRF